MALDNDDLETIKQLLLSSSRQEGGASGLFDMEARDRIIQTNELVKQLQSTQTKSIEQLEVKISALEEKLDRLEKSVKKSEELTMVFDKRYASLARWLNHYQSWSIMLAVATVISVILGIRYFPF